MNAISRERPVAAARIVLASAALALACSGAAAQKLSGAAYTTTKAGTAVNKNVFATASDVYLSGGPQNAHAAGLPDGRYFFQVTDPSGRTVLSTDDAACRQLTVTGGRVSGAAGSCPHASGSFNAATGGTPVQLAPFSTSTQPGAEYKAWLVPAGKASIGSDPRVLVFAEANAKTDNFKTREAALPQGSCQPSSSLSVLVSGTNVTSYVPKGQWMGGGGTNVAVVNVEGASIVPQLIATPDVVNSCASNSATGQTVCTANNTDVYLISGVTLASTLTSAGTGTLFFSGGSCTNCGVAMDAVHNRALIGLSLAGAGGYQYLNLNGVPALEPAFASMAPLGGYMANISEDILIDPTMNLILSPNEMSNFELVDVTSPAAPVFYEQAIPDYQILDSAGEDCSTGIALSPAEFSGPSAVYVADLTQAAFTPGVPGTWSSPAQVQLLSESILSQGASGVAIAQGTHSGVVTGEFLGDALTAVALPATSGTGTPAITDWVTCNIGNGFKNGFDPHTVTAYKSPNGGNAIAVLSNAFATMLAVVDVTRMLDPAIVPRTAAGHGCAAETLPSTVVRFITVP